MIVDDIIFSGLREFIKELFEIDQYYYEKGLSNKDGGIDGRVRLGNNQASVLEQIMVTFKLSDLTLLDLDVISSFASSVSLINPNGPGFTSLNAPTNKCVNIHYKKSPFSSVVDLSGVPDVLRYTEEAFNNYNEIKKTNHYLAIRLSPIGCFKVQAIAYFKGLDILSLFNGFIESFIYSHFDNIESYDDKMKTVAGEIYRNFISIFTKKYYQEATKSSLIEDYMIYDDYYSYVNKDYSAPSVSLAKVIHPCGRIDFFGNSSNEMTDQLSMFRKKYDDRIATKDTTYLYFACSTDFFTFLTLKTCAKNIKIVGFEKLDILYSDTNYRFPLSMHDKSTYEVRINMMLHHNKEARNIVLNDRSDKEFVSNTNLSDPSLKYGMILAGQQIRYLIEVALENTSYITLKQNTPRLLNSNLDVLTVIDKISELSTVFRKASWT